jgi:hypothetical protein
VPQWSSGEMIGYLSCDLIWFTDEVKLRFLGKINGGRSVVLAFLWEFGEQIIVRLLSREERGERWSDGIGGDGERWVSSNAINGVMISQVENFTRFECVFYHLFMNEFIFSLSSDFASTTMLTW